MDLVFISIQPAYVCSIPHFPTHQVMTAFGLGIESVYIGGSYMYVVVAISLAVLDLFLWLFFLSFSCSLLLWFDDTL